jgi:TetR/AcrR family transcriptional regulator, transcriptional repressor of bet genes
VPGEKQPETERREAILEGAYRVAARETLGGLSMRRVAQEAGVSKGLVFFHFSSKEKLLLALLDWMLERGPRLEVPADLESGGAGDPTGRLLELVAHEVALLEEEPSRVELFLDFWVMGTGVPEIQRRIHAAFEAYRGDFQPHARAVIDAFPERFGDGDAAGLAAVVVSFIQGCALQLIANPSQFDLERYMRAVRGLVLGD